MIRIIACLAFIALGAHAQAPRDADGFRNNYPHPEKQSFWAWKWEQVKEGVPKPPPGGWNLPAMKADPAALRAPANNPSMTWIGHASVLVHLAGKNVLSTRSSRSTPRRFRRRAAANVPLPIDVPELPSIDVVMISHNHYDHLDLDSVQRLAAMPGGGPPLFSCRWG